MKYWVKKEASTDNVVVLAKTGVLVASCDEKACDGVEKQLAADTHPLEIFAKDDVDTIKFTQVRRILSRSTEDEVEILYTEKKDTETADLKFADQQAKQEFLSTLEKVLPENLTKTQYQQSVFSAIFPSLMSTAAALVTGYFYINKLRWVTLIVGGLWLALSLYMLVARFRQPPEIVRWTPSGQYAKKAMGGIKTAFSYAVVAAIVISFSSQLPLTHGKAALYDQMERYELTADEVKTLVGNGADPNYHPPETDSPLHMALYRDQAALVTELLAAGAGPELPGIDGYTALEAALNYSDEATFKAVLDGSSNLNNHKQLRQEIASGSPATERVDLLLGRGFDLQGKNEEGKNLLQLALEEYANYDLIAYLLENHIDTDFTINSLPPAEYARQEGRLDVANLLAGGGSAVSADRLAAINRQLDELVVTIVKEQSQATLDAMDPKLKGLMKALNAADDLETVEPAEFYEPVFEQAMIAKGNAMVLRLYAEHCASPAFENGNALNEAISTRLESRDKYLQLADLLVERDQMIWFKDEQRLPSELLTDHKNKVQQWREKFKSPETTDKETLPERCQQQLDQLTEPQTAGRSRETVVELRDSRLS